jgi:alpha-L-fucosidase 2
MPVFASRSYANLEYCRSGGRPLCMDGHVPSGRGPFPAAVIVHGGGWVAGDRRMNVEPLFRVLSDAGFAWFSISYTLATTPFEFGSAYVDVERALAFLSANAAAYDIDPARVAVIGESAGGQLAAMAALRKQTSPVAALVAFYAPMDLERAFRESGFSAALGGVPMAGAVAARLGSLSPVRHVRPGMPPLLLIHGREDEVVPFSQSEDMCRAVRAVGGCCDLIAVRGGGHGLRRWESAGLTGYKALMIDWLSRRLHAQ